MHHSLENSASRRSLFAIGSQRVVTPAGEIPAAILIENGIILDVVPVTEIPAGVSLMEFGSAIISPGVIDAHVHINEPGRTEWEGFATATAAAAAGGVTTLIDMPLNSSPVTTDAAALEAKRSAAGGRCRVDVGFYGGVTPGKVQHLSGLLDAGVLGVKAFLCDSGLPEFPSSGELELRQALGVLSESGVPLLVHAELVSEVTEVETPRSYREYADSRPPEFELRAIRLLIKLAREFKTPVHIVHLATSAAIPLIREAKQEGLPLTVETCPHYLYFSDDQIADGETSFKCAPPIRDAANRDAMCEAVSDGLIDTIGSDHSPCPAELKCLDSGDFSEAWGGIASLQLTLPVVWTVGQKFSWSPQVLAQRLSARPAEIFGLSDRKGKISVGFDADLVVWDPDQSFFVSGAKLFHRHSITPYQGRELRGCVQKTFLRGQLIFDVEQASNPQDGKAAGKLLARKSGMALAQCLNRMTESGRLAAFKTCCGATAWVQQMFDGGEFSDDVEVFARSTAAWQVVSELDLLEAFAAHPQIGDIESLRQKWAHTKQLAGQEQAGIGGAGSLVLERLADGNRAYLEKFGFIFIVCATGKTAAEMLELLEKRLPNERATELELAATEQLKITHLRLRKLIS